MVQTFQALMGRAKVGRTGKIRSPLPSRGEKPFGLSSLRMLAIGLTFLSSAAFPAQPNSTTDQKPSSKLSDEQVLHLGNNTEPQDLDPTITTGSPESHIIDNLFEGLTSLHPFTLDPAPGMAESWTISADGKTYVFKIRNQTAWSDGTPLTAKDFVWSWVRALKPETAAQYAYQLYHIKNAEKFNQGKIKDEKELGVRALDERTLEVVLENPTPYFLRLTSFHTLYPTPKHIVEKYGKEWTKENHIVSNGAFKLVEWKMNRHVKIVPNPKYWDHSKVNLKEVYFLPIENSDTEEKSFTSGEIQLTGNVPSLKIPSYRAEQQKNPSKYSALRVNPFLAVYFYRMNVKKPPLDNVLVRRALALTVDRKLIVEKITKAGQLPATAFTPPVEGYSYTGPGLPASVTPEVIQEAKTLLAKAGYPDGKGMPKIELLYNTLEDHKRIAVVIQQMWKKHLNVDVDLFNQEWKVYLDTQRTGNYSLARGGWIGDYPDPNTFLDLFVSNGGNNQTGWSNKEYDKHIEEAALTTDQAKRFTAFAKAEAILLEELPVLPVYIYTQVKLVAEQVKMIDPQSGEIMNWKSNILDRLHLKYYALVGK
ncbi:MAG: peptide ABC transporter substrate-binding protein [Oligoflexales bacterium]|nr:peptide ABC transporter substrate-binding protein [Oligoflexales bacterium]